jgi:succinate dehydrogenase hydrophobic anchor subunit
MTEWENVSLGELFATIVMTTFAWFLLITVIVTVVHARSWIGHGSASKLLAYLASQGWRGWLNLFRVVLLLGLITASVLIRLSL